MQFESYDTWFDTPYYQTLEPQVQYLYRPYVDQSEIPLPDASLTQDTFFMLRERHYAGIDRINNAHQLAIGFNSDLFKQYTELKWNFSLGRFILKSRVTLSEDHPGAAD